MRNKQGSCKFAHLVSGSFSPPHVSCCFQDGPKDTSMQTKLTICTYNIKWDSDILKLDDFLQEKKPDVICLQEVKGEKELMVLLEYLKRTKSKFAFAGRSSMSHCAVLSTLPLREVKQDYFLVKHSSFHLQVVRDNLSMGKEFVTVMVQGILITCIHLQYQAGEEGRIVQLKSVWDELRKKGGWKGVKHIFAGDFNSLTWEDKSKDEWDRVAEEMRGSKKDKLCSDFENNLCIKVSTEVDKSEKKFVEGPKFDLTKLMKNHGFTDCWLDVRKRKGKLGDLGQIGEQATCR